MKITELEPLFKKLELARQKRYDLIKINRMISAGGTVLEDHQNKVTITSRDIELLKDFYNKRIEQIKAEIEEV